MEMALDYDWRFTTPAQTLSVHMENFKPRAVGLSPMGRSAGEALVWFRRDLRDYDHALRCTRR